MDFISSLYKDDIIKMLKYAKRPTKVTIDDVYQEGNPDILPFIDKMVTDQLENGSDIELFKNLEELYNLSKQGKKCILLLEHYSNFDLPSFHLMLRKHGEIGKEIADNLIAIAGIKMSESNPVVTAFSEAYTRLVIYPSRSIEALSEKYLDVTELQHEIKKATAINLASMKKLAEMRKNGKLILVFPAGTRYRPGNASTKKGVREIDSYMRSFDYCCLVSMNGLILKINPNGEMQEDIVNKDKVIFRVSKVYKCQEYREVVKAKISSDCDKKQAVVDAIMEELEIMHDAVEKTRK